MPVFPTSSFPVAAFASEIGFLRSAVDALIPAGALGPSVRPLAAAEDRQLNALARHHGDRLLRRLAHWGGGEHDQHFGRLRDWASGAAVSVADFRATLDHFEDVLTDPARDLARSVRPSAAAPALLKLLKGTCEIEHANRVFRVNGVAVDPLLDAEPLPDVFSFFETVTEGGPRFEAPSLGIAVCADPGASVTGFADLFARLEDGSVVCYLLERLLYAVSKDRVPADVAAKIETAVENHFLVRVEPVPRHSQVVNPRKEALHSAPWEDERAMGPLDLERAADACERRWRRGLDRPAFDDFSEIPAAHAWLEANADDLDWSDVRKIRKEREWIWTCAFDGKISDGQRESCVKRLQGVLGEVGHRKAIVSGYLALPPHADPAFRPLLVLEGQVLTADGKMTSDAVLGWIDPRARRFALSRVTEVVATAGQETSTQAQHEKNRARRFPEKGLVIFAEGGAWGRAFPEGAAVHETWIPSEAEHRRLRRDAEAIVDQLLGWAALKRAATVAVPAEKRRTLASHGDRISVARLLKSVLASAWKDAGNPPDVRTVDLNLTGLIGSASGALKEMLEVYQAGLRNVSRDLNPGGMRRSATAVAATLGTVTSATVLKYQGEAEETLKGLGFAVLKDGNEKAAKMHSSRFAAKTVWERAWEDADSLDVICERLKTIADAPETAAEIREHLLRYLAVIDNLSADRNAAGARAGGNEMSRSHGMPVSTYRDLRDDIEPRMAAAKYPVLPDPNVDQAHITVAAKKADETVKRCWTAAENAAAMVEALEKEAQKQASDVAERIRDYRTVLVNLSADLNASGKRKGLETLAEETAGAYATLHKRQKEIEAIMGERGWPVLAAPSPGTARVKRVSEDRKIAVESAWKGARTVEEVVARLERHVSTCEDELERRHTTAYLAVLRDTSADLNPSKRRTSSEKLAETDGVSASLIYTAREDVEKRLAKMGADAVKNQFAARGSQAKASVTARKLWETAAAGASTAREAAEALERAAQASSDPHVQRYLGYYRAALTNLSASLNSEGRKSPFEIGSRLGAGQQVMIDYHAKVEAAMKARGWDVLPR